VSASVLQAGGATALDQVRRLVRDREVLRPGFMQAWQRLAHADAAVVEEWAGVTLELLRVNAGPSCIGAFWQAGAVAGPGLLQPVLAGGRAAAGICRHAGARAALDCLEALPAAIRLTRGDPAGQAAWWHGLDRLAREAPGLVQGVARQVEVLLAGGDGMGRRRSTTRRGGRRSSGSTTRWPRRCCCAGRVRRASPTASGCWTPSSRACGAASRG